MRNYPFSILLGLTSTIAVSTSLPVKAATFDYNQLRLITSRPITSNNSLNFYGAPTKNQGSAAFYNLDTSALNHGHREIGLNSRKDFIINNAPYYTTGRPGSPEVPPVNATRTASVNEILGFPTLNSYVKDNGIKLSTLGFNYGQKSDRSFTSTWNLGSDKLGVDWFATKDSTLEERIYKANPNDVELGLYYDKTKIVNLGYSPLYSIQEYGPTTSFDDDFESYFSDPLTVEKVSGLNPLLDNLANAFVQDVAASGGGIQLLSEQLGSSDTTFTDGNGYGVFRLPVSIGLRVVPITAVPEDSTVLGLLITGSLLVVSRLKQKK